MRKKVVFSNVVAYKILIGVWF